MQERGGNEYAARRRLSYAVSALTPASAVYLSAAAYDTFAVLIWSVLIAPAIFLGVALACGTMPALRLWAMFGSAVAVALSVALTHWPLRLTFAVSRPALERLADRLEAGETVSSPQWAGLFYVRKAEINHGGMPCLWLNLEPNGYTGFARPSDGIAIGKYNDWSDYPLWQKWHLISED